MTPLVPICVSLSHNRKNERLLLRLVANSSPQLLLSLITENLIPQIIISLNPLSLSVGDVLEIHARLISIIDSQVRLATPRRLNSLKIEHQRDQQSVHETVLHHLLVPSEAYLRTLCTNRILFVDGNPSEKLMCLFAQLLQICAYYQPTMDFVLNLPVVLTITSYLPFVEAELSLWFFLDVSISSLKEWNKERGDVHRLGTRIFHSLRMEGIDDVSEQRLQTIITTWLTLVPSR
ncbi:hypothetical protein BLNAU_10752 [Blattamonas nauphoetae]|uniref:Uncharacterized protein n=1 Tax=Blattamonas nauphoetae TaxID=2049346 RepID=A0ABQ9XPB3_9EUKA|nr:hypothetical protein BLNAU_10752 [Blattamonas nauphoetae]